MSEIERARENGWMKIYRLPSQKANDNGFKRQAGVKAIIIKDWSGLTLNVCPVYYAHGVFLVQTCKNAYFWSSVRTIRAESVSPRAFSLSCVVLSG